MYIDGYNTTVEYTTNDSDWQTEEAGADAWTEITDVDGITLPPIDVAKVDNHHFKTADRTKTRRPGWLDPGDGAFVFKSTKAQMASTYALTAVQKGFRVTLSDGSIFKWNGFINKFGSEIDKEGDNTVGCSVATSGLPVFTPAA